MGKRVFNINESLIIAGKYQSGMISSDWLLASTTGFYNNYTSLRNLDIDPKMITYNNLKFGEPWNSGQFSDFLTLPPWYQSKTTQRPSHLGPMYSFSIELMNYLNLIDYTKNVIIANNAIGSSSFRSRTYTMDWKDNSELSLENHERFNEIIHKEQVVNGNSSQFIMIQSGGEADLSDVDSHLNVLKDAYHEDVDAIGHDFPLFMGQLTPRNTESIEMNEVLFEFANDPAYPNVYVIGQDLPEGRGTYEQMQIDDPDGVIIASDWHTFTAIDQHKTPSADMLTGRQLFDLSINNYFNPII